jgi:hypothetical protein
VTAAPEPNPVEPDKGDELERLPEESPFERPAFEEIEKGLKPPDVESR